jgi:hypothetical protein
MTSKTSILLIVSQQPGIDYQALLSKIAPNYANLNSARAALSRVLKDAVSFGMVTKQNHQLFLTDKGSASLKVKMHDKLVLKLNQLMNVRSVASNPDPLVQHLSILLERGKMDPRLFDNARASVNFSVDDVLRVHEGVKQNIKHLEYLEKSLSTQLSSLRDLNFPSEKVKHVHSLAEHIPKLIDVSSADEIQIEHPQIDFSQQPNHSFLEGFSPITKGVRASISTKHLDEMVKRFSTQSELENLRAYMGFFTLNFSRDNVTIRGPSQLLDKLGLVSDAHVTQERTLAASKITAQNSTVSREETSARTQPTSEAPETMLPALPLQELPLSKKASDDENVETDDENSEDRL